MPLIVYALLIVAASRASAHEAELAALSSRKVSQVAALLRDISEKLATEREKENIVYNEIKRQCSSKAADSQNTDDIGAEDESEDVLSKKEAAQPPMKAPSPVASAASRVKVSNSTDEATDEEPPSEQEAPEVDAHDGDDPSTLAAGEDDDVRELKQQTPPQESVTVAQADSTEDGSEDGSQDSDDGNKDGETEQTSGGSPESSQLAAKLSPKAPLHAVAVVKTESRQKLSSSQDQHQRPESDHKPSAQQLSRTSSPATRRAAVHAAETHPGQLPTPKVGSKQAVARHVPVATATSGTREVTHAQEQPPRKSEVSHRQGAPPSPVAKSTVRRSASTPRALAASPGATAAISTESRKKTKAKTAVDVGVEQIADDAMIADYESLASDVLSIDEQATSHDDLAAIADAGPLNQSSSKTAGRSVPAKAKSRTSREPTKMQRVAQEAKHMESGSPAQELTKALEEAQVKKDDMSIAAQSAALNDLAGTIPSIEKQAMQLYNTFGGDAASPETFGSLSNGLAALEFFQMSKRSSRRTMGKASRLQQSLDAAWDALKVVSEQSQADMSLIAMLRKSDGAASGLIRMEDECKWLLDNFEHRQKVRADQAAELLERSKELLASAMMDSPPSRSAKTKHLRSIE